MLSCSIRFSAPSFWVGGGLESRCVGRMCGAGVAVRLNFIKICIDASHCKIYELFCSTS